MKITKRPIRGIRNFHCEDCETDFSAWENEYKISSSRRLVDSKGGVGIFGFLKTILVYQPTKEISCGCPVCSSDCVIEIDWGEKYEQEYFDPS